MSPDGYWVLVLCHMFGDYFLQNDWQAKNKKAPGIRGMSVCMIHVSLYMIPFLFTGLLWWQLVLIFVQHYMQDRMGVVRLMRWIGKNDFLKPPFAPWSIILIDNLLHLFWIAVVAKIGELI